VPELRFELDESARQGFRISRLIDEAARPAEGHDQEQD
jgi:ribosome-binding factor A